MFDNMLTEEAFNSAMMLLGAECQDGEWVFDSPDERYTFVWRPSDSGPEGTVRDTDGTEVAAAWEFALSESTDPVLWLTGVIMGYIPHSYFESLREWVTVYVIARVADEYLRETNSDAFRRTWNEAGLRFYISSEHSVISFEWPLVDLDDEFIIFGMRAFDLNDVLNAYMRRDTYGLDDWLDEYAVDIAEYLDLLDKWDDADDEGDDDD